MELHDFDSSIRDNGYALRIDRTDTRRLMTLLVRHGCGKCNLVRAEGIPQHQYRPLVCEGSRNRREVGYAFEVEWHPAKCWRGERFVKCMRFRAILGQRTYLIENLVPSVQVWMLCVGLCVFCVFCVVLWVGA